MIEIAMYEVIKSAPEVVALVADRIRPSRLTLNLALPAIYYAKRRTQPNVAHTGYTGYSKVDFDIGINASTYIDSARIAAALSRHLLAYTRMYPIPSIYIERIFINNQFDVSLSPEELKTEQYACVFDVTVAYRSN